MSKHTNPTPEGFDIVEARTVAGGRYDACGKCGARLHTDQTDRDARDAMAAKLEEAVFAPLGLLAGLLANVKEDDDNEAGLGIVGNLLGLVVVGARQELEIQQAGGIGAYTIEQWLACAKEEEGQI